MAWLIFPFALLVVMVLGVRVIRNKGAPPSKSRDEASIREWEKEKRKGFVMHCLYRTFPFAVSYFLLGPLTKSWWQLGKLEYPIEKVPSYIVFAVLCSLVTGFFSWGMLSSSAAEASERLKDSQTI